ncbi:hypothetical protein [Thiorhodococcus drewsii]|uniref:hypothetical protein n=1 Tax=Thiorhodococcus drewsii TaxID=210408 RepID=UPI001C1E3EEE|nr:hypothetical protein [Thiorhodococcus drewsii]
MSLAFVDGTYKREDEEHILAVASKLSIQPDEFSVLRDLNRKALEANAAIAEFIFKD